MKAARFAAPVPPHGPAAPAADRRRGLHPPVRMLHIITRLIRGGADENTLYTVKGLDRRRYQVDLVVGQGSDLELLRGLDGVRVHVLEDLTRDPHPVRDVVALIRLALIIRRGGYQIVHTHTAKAGFLGRLAAALAGTPIIVHTVHGVTFPQHVPQPLRAFYLLLERIAGRFTHQFVTVGEDMRSLYIKAGIGDPQAYQTIYSGMPLHDFLEAGQVAAPERDRLRAALGFGPEHQLVVTAARLEARKGHGYLFQAVARVRLRHPGMRVLVLGDGPLRAALERRTRELGIDDVVSFLGHRTDFARVLAAADVSVLTSLWEGLPRVLVQSAAAGKPILTFDVEGAWEVVRDGENGFIVPSRDIDALSRRLDQLLVDRVRAEAMGAAGPARVSAEWTVETMVDRLDRLYQKLTLERAA
jgi:glycosyltransferase involved in cell wall biosynthesis